MITVAYMTATVWAPDGGKVKMRAEPSKDCNKYWNIPTGTELNLIEQNGDWCQVASEDHEGYMMTKYLMIGEVTFNAVDDDNVTVDRNRLEKIYDEIGDILGMRG